VERVKYEQRQLNNTWWTEMLGEDRVGEDMLTDQGRGQKKVYIWTW